jgi:hypothetical protein
MIATQLGISHLQIPQTDNKFVTKRKVVSFICSCLRLTKSRFIPRLASNVQTACELCTQLDGQKWAKKKLVRMGVAYERSRIK